MSIVETRCPQCGALLRGDAAWCTLCHADLRPPPEPEPEPAPVVIDPLTAPLEQVLAHTGQPVVDVPAEPPVPTLHPDGSVEFPDESVASAGASGDATSLDDIQDTDVMFALLRAQSQDPVLAKYGGRFADKQSRMLLIAGGMTVLTVVFFAGFALVGLLVR